MVTNIRLRNARRGMTLVELLMVISIMTVLLAVAIPMMRPAFQDRQVREAARQVNAFFAGARARAAETGRPVGVWIERRDGTTVDGRLHSAQLFMAEVAPAFTGATLNSTVMVNTTGVMAFPAPADELVLRSLISAGQLFTIRFDHKGPWYKGTFDGTSFGVATQPPGTGTVPGAPYEILRAPTRSMVSPLSLPGETIIDLTVSGMGSSGNDFSAAPGGEPVMITFSPNGRVEHVYYYVPNPLVPGTFLMTSDRAFGSIFLLIGRRSKLITDFTSPDFLDEEKSNLFDPTSLWLTINHLTGSIVTADNADIRELPPPPPPPPVVVGPHIRAARELARTSNRKGGR